MCTLGKYLTNRAAFPAPFTSLFIKADEFKNDAIEFSISVEFLFVQSSGGGTSLEYPQQAWELLLLMELHPQMDRQTPIGGQTDSPWAPPQDKDRS